MKCIKCDQTKFTTHGNYDDYARCENCGQVNLISREDREAHKKEMEARHRLEDAAPELLYALKQVHAAYCGDIYDFKAKSLPEALNIVMKAIAKAEGK